MPDAKLQMLGNLIHDCFAGGKTHSQLYTYELAILDHSPTCPKTFDGFACWDAAPPGTISYQHCPDIVVGFDPTRYAFKRCMPNGTWFVHPEGKKPWTNYTACIDVEDLNFRSAVNTIYVTGYAISVVALLISIAIFIYFRRANSFNRGALLFVSAIRANGQLLWCDFEGLGRDVRINKSLQCTRIKIHMHLFASFALNNLLWIVWYKTVIDQVDVVQNNEEWCQVLHVITNYFMVTSYIWMFCEGLHLHIALVVVFVKDDLAMLWFMAIGWGLPVLIVGLYAGVRYQMPGATVRLVYQDFSISSCWMENSDSFWIIVVPVVISLLASFVFLVNVIRVLLTKLHPGPIRHVTEAAKKAVRASLILIPLFGLHFVMIPLVPAPNTPGERVYQVFSALLTSLQGLCVAILFCFTNNDVVTTMKAAITRLMKKDEAIPMTGMGTTAGESLMHTRENVA